MRNLIKRFGVLAATLGLTALLGGVVAAGPAFAANPPCVPQANGSCDSSSSVTVTVPAGISLTNVSPTITFTVPAPATVGGVPGYTAQALNAEMYNVQTNDSAGYSLVLQPGSNNFSGTFIGGKPSTTPIPNTDLTVNEVVNGGGAHPQTFDAANDELTLYSSPGPSLTTGDTFAEDWFLNIPGSLDSANYTETFTYIAQANQS